MITLATLGGGTTLALGGSKAQKTQGPPLNAQSPDEESFIKYVAFPRIDLGHDINSRKGLPQAGRDRTEEGVSSRSAEALDE